MIGNLEMVGKGLIWLEMAELKKKKLNVAVNDWIWWEMSENGWECLEVSKNVWK